MQQTFAIIKPDAVASGHTGQILAMIGDLFHHPAALEHPHWRCGFAWAAQAAASTRVQWIQELREARTPVVGPHFPDFTPVVLR